MNIPHPRARLICALLGSYVLVAGAISLAGWILNIQRWTDWHNYGVSIMPNATVCAVCAGAALLLLAVSQSGRVAACLGAVVGLIGGATFFEYVTNIDLGIDRLLIYREWGQRGTVAPGRMGPPGSTSWMIIGTALVLMRGGPRMRRTAVACGLLAISIAMLSLVGYAFGAERLFTIPRLTTIAIQTASMIFAMGVGIVLAMPERQPAQILLADSTAGVLARRVLPFVFIVPIVLGWLRLRGQQAGLFDAAFGTASRTLIEVALLTGMLWWALATVSAKEAAIQRGQAQVVERDRLLRTVTEHTQVGLVIISPDHRYIYSNHAYSEVLGLDSDQIIGRRVEEVLPTVYEAQIRPRLQTAFAGQRVQHELTVPDRTGAGHPPGSARSVAAAYEPQLKDGQVQNVVVAVADITARVQAEESARRRTAQFETLLNEAPIGVYLINNEFRIHEVNPIARAVFGNIPDLIGRDFDEVIHILWPKAFADEVVQLFRKTLETGEPYYTPECIESRRDLGQTEYYEWQINRIPLPAGRYGVVCYFRDIARQVQARQSIAESEERYRSLVSVVTDVPWTTNADGMFVTPQLPWSKYTGQSWEEYRGAGWVNALHPEDRGEAQRMWEYACRTRTNYVMNGRMFHAASGEYRHIVGRAVPILESDGSVREWVGSCTDVHEQKIASQKLERTVAERTAQLRDTVQQLETFSYSIVHDMRAPLRSMRSFAGFLQSEYEEKLDKTGLDYLSRIISSSARLDALITDVLNYSRVSMTEAELQRVNLDALLKDLIEQYPQFQEAAENIHLEGVLPPVLGNTALLTQVFSNLMGNALKFVVPDRPARVTIRAEQLDGKRVRLWVEDNGIGIPPEHRQKLFGLFQRLHRPDEYAGTGVGLAIVKKAVERMGGTVGVESGAEHGSRFWVELNAMPVGPHA